MYNEDIYKISSYTEIYIIKTITKNNLSWFKMKNYADFKWGRGGGGYCGGQWGGGGVWCRGWENKKVLLYVILEPYTKVQV